MCVCDDVRFSGPERAGDHWREFLNTIFFWWEIFGFLDRSCRRRCFRRQKDVGEQKISFGASLLLILAACARECVLCASLTEVLCMCPAENVSFDDAARVRAQWTTPRHRVPPKRIYLYTRSPNTSHEYPFEIYCKHNEG